MTRGPIGLGPLLALMGGSTVSEAAATFLGMLAAELVRTTNFHFATTSFAGHPDSGKPSAALVFSTALQKELGDAGVLGRLSTFTDEKARPNEHFFSAGTAVAPRGRTTHSKRLFMIQRSDVVCVLGGSDGIKELYNLALAIEKPVLPLPFAGGGAKDAWHTDQSMIAADFGLAESTVRRWNAARIDRCSPQKLQHIANEVAEALQGGSRHRCFVIMPFDDSFDDVYDHLIVPALQIAHYEPIRTDREGITGDITEFLRNEIRTCDCCIAVVTGANPNVMYEIGLADALRKPALLLIDADLEQTGIDCLPFDIRNHRTIRYPSSVDSSNTELCIREIHDTLRPRRYGTGGKDVSSESACNPNSP